MRTSFICSFLFFGWLLNLSAAPVEYTRSVYNNYIQAGVSNLSSSGSAYSDIESINASVGFKTSQKARAEIQYSMIDGISSIDINTLMLNWAYDYYIQPKIFIYGLAGIGVAKVEIKNWRSATLNKYVFSYQFNIGIGYAISDSVTTLLGYRNIFTDLSLAGKGTCKSSGIDLSIQYSF